MLLMNNWPLSCLLIHQFAGNELDVQDCYVRVLFTEQQRGPPDDAC